MFEHDHEYILAYLEKWHFEKVVQYLSVLHSRNDLMPF